MFHLQEYNGAQCYLIEDEFNSRFFRIGLSEYHLVSQLDGTVTMSDAIARSSSQLGGEALGEQEAINIFKWLIDSGLATTSASRSSGRLIESSDKSQRRKQIAKLNPVTPKFPLFNPDRLLEKLTRIGGWLFSFPMFIAWCIIVGISTYHVHANWELMFGGQSNIFARDNWIWLILTWSGLKILHELAHGVACKRYGGEVRQCGIVLIVLIPLPFVDVTSSWRFRSKWKKIYVAAAGMYIEVFFAALAAIAWCYLDSPVLKQHAMNLMLAGTVTTLLFNANPLMRFDGYYILSDWLELPNLGTHGQQWLKWVGKKFYLGMEAKQPTWPEAKGKIVATYAIVAFWWKIVICVGLAILAESLFFGAGVVLALMASVLWVVVPTWKLIKMVFIGEETQQRPSRFRFCSLTLGLLLASWIVFTQVPWYARVDAHAVVDCRDRIEIRTPVGGFLEEIRVSTGDLVEAGQILARLENVQLESDIDKLQVEVEATENRIRSLRNSLELAACDVEYKNLDALQQQLTERIKQKEQLEIRASAPGIIVGESLESLAGVYVSPGHKLCSLEPSESKEVHALVAQQDFELFQSRVGESVQVHVWGEGYGYLDAKLSQVNPRGRVDLPHPAFGASAGGPLPVRYQQASENSEEETEVEVALVDPHFLARVSIDSTTSLRLRSGQPAFVSFRANRGSIGQVASEKLTQWIRTLRERTKAAQNF